MSDDEIQPPERQPESTETPVAYVLTPDDLQLLIGAMSQKITERIVAQLTDALAEQVVTAVLARLDGQMQARAVVQQRAAQRSWLGSGQQG